MTADDCHEYSMGTKKLLSLIMKWTHIFKVEY
jgi:hypothetical protein